MSEKNNITDKEALALYLNKKRKSTKIICNRLIFSVFIFLLIVIETLTILFAAMPQLHKFATNQGVLLIPFLLQTTLMVLMIVMWKFNATTRFVLYKHLATSSVNGFLSQQSIDKANQFIKEIEDIEKEQDMREKEATFIVLTNNISTKGQMKLHKSLNNPATLRNKVKDTLSQAEVFTITK